MQARQIVTFARIDSQDACLKGALASRRRMSDCDNPGRTRVALALLERILLDV